MKTAEEERDRIVSFLLDGAEEIQRLTEGKGFYMQNLWGAKVLTTAAFAIKDGKHWEEPIDNTRG